LSPSYLLAACSIRATTALSHRCGFE
jgi:hypothetical protein